MNETDERLSEQTNVCFMLGKGKRAGGFVYVQVLCLPVKKMERREGLGVYVLRASIYVGRGGLFSPPLIFSLSSLLGFAAVTISIAAAVANVANVSGRLDLVVIIARSYYRERETALQVPVEREKGEGRTSLKESVKTQLLPPPPSFLPLARPELSTPNNHNNNHSNDDNRQHSSLLGSCTVDRRPNPTYADEWIGQAESQPFGLLKNDFFYNNDAEN